MRMSNETYDVLKWIQRIVLPALATFYLALGTIWTGIIELPYPEAISATITAVDALLGTLLGVSAANYNKEMEVLGK